MIGGCALIGGAQTKVIGGKTGTFPFSTGVTEFIVEVGCLIQSGIIPSNILASGGANFFDRESNPISGDDEIEAQMEKKSSKP